MCVVVVLMFNFFVQLSLLELKRMENVWKLTAKTNTCVSLTKKRGVTSNVKPLADKKLYGFEQNVWSKPMSKMFGKSCLLKRHGFRFY